MAEKEKTVHKIGRAIFGDKYFGGHSTRGKQLSDMEAKAGSLRQGNGNPQKKKKSRRQMLQDI